MPNLNDLFRSWGIESAKPLLTALCLPPAPFLLLALAGLVLVSARHRRSGAVLVATGLALSWLGGCIAVAAALTPWLLPATPALSETRIVELQRQARDRVAIVVLGSGVEPWAPEYGTSNLTMRSLERLRYGIWLSRRTGWPVGFSGGIGWGQRESAPRVAEATVARRIAAEEFHHPLAWAETTSRDTRENAVNTLALLRPQGIDRLLIVTDAWHMPRAVRDFERAAGSRPLAIDRAPMDLADDTERPLARWLPSGDGTSRMRAVVREWLGWRGGA